MEIVRHLGKSPSRGRPRGHQSYSTMSILTSIAQIAAKHSLDPGLLLDAFAEAWKYEESQCERLRIRCRRVDQDLATFLVTRGQKVVWQFSINVKILQEPKLFKSYIPIVSIPAQIHKDDSTKKNICELRIPMRGITVKAKIVEVPPKRLVNTRYGFDAYVSNVLLADNTGTIRLSLWNGQIDDVSVGDTVNIEKASVARFRGELQLRISRNGTMSVDTHTRIGETVLKTAPVLP